MAGHIPKYADSIAQAAAILSAAGTPCSVPDLKRAKRDGCTAFKGSRVYFEPLQEWLAQNVPEEPEDPEELESKDVLERRRLLEQVLKIRFSRRVDEGKFLANEKAAQDALSAGTSLRGEVLQFISDLPSMAGMTAEQMHAKGMEWFNEQLCPRMNSLDAYS